MRQAFAALPDWVKFAIVLTTVPIIVVSGRRERARLQRIAASESEPDDARQAARKRLRIHRWVGVLMVAIMFVLVVQYGDWAFD